MTIGETLKRARKKLNLDLNEVAKATKIAKMFLIALENDDIAKLPEGVYARNFLRTYAKFLKLDEDIITAEYHEQYRIKPHFVVHHEQTKNDNLQFKRSRNKNLVVFFLLVGIPLALVYLYMRYDEEITEELARWMEPVPLESQAPVQTAAQGPLTANHKEPPEPVPAQTQPEERVSGSEPVEAAPEGNHDDPQEAAGEVTDSLQAGAGPPADDPSQSIEAEIPEPVVIGDPLILPVTAIEDVDWTGDPGGSLEDLFAIEALAEVRIDVIVDGQILTQRALHRGEVRFYKYGAYNSVLIGDTARISVQDGTSFRALPGVDRTNVRFDFGPGEFLEAMDKRLARPRMPEEQQP